MSDRRLGKVRWCVKKAARHGVAVGTSMIHPLRLRTGHRCELRALTYHRFGDQWPRDPFCVGLESFKAQMHWLAENGLAVSLDDVEAFIAGHKPLPSGSVLVTIDDGFRSVATAAAPILTRYQIPAVAYVTAGFVGSAAESSRQPEPFMDWEELSALCESGITVGSHAFSHRSLGRMPLEEAREEAERSRELLESKLGRPVRSFAYPFGTPRHYTDATTRILREAGYATGFLSLHGAITAGLDPLQLPRVKVEGGESLWMFRQSCGGAMDPWATVDHAVSAIRAAL